MSIPAMTDKQWDYICMLVQQRDVSGIDDAIQQALRAMHEREIAFLEQRLEEARLELAQIQPPSWPYLTVRDATVLIDWLKETAPPLRPEVRAERAAVRYAAEISAGPPPGYEHTIVAPDIECPHCEAAPGELCHRPSGDVLWTKLHSARATLAGVHPDPLSRVARYDHPAIVECAEHGEFTRWIDGSNRVLFDRVTGRCPVAGCVQSTNFVRWVDPERAIAHEQAVAEIKNRYPMLGDHPDVACPHCAAEAGQPCRTPSAVMQRRYHAPRAILAGVPSDLNQQNVSPFTVACDAHGDFTVWEVLHARGVMQDWMIHHKCPFCRTKLRLVREAVEGIAQTSNASRS